MKRRLFFGMLAGLLSCFGLGWIFERQYPIVREERSDDPRTRRFTVFHSPDAGPLQVMRSEGIPLFGSEWNEMVAKELTCSCKNSWTGRQWLVEVRYL